MAKKKVIKKTKVVASDEAIVPEEMLKRNSGGVWSNIKLFFVTVLICLLIFVAGYIYLWVQNYRNLQAESKAAQSKSDQLEMDSQDLWTVKIKVQEQVSNCNGLIAQGSGDFSQFEYCKKFIEWSRSLPSTVLK